MKPRVFDSFPIAGTPTELDLLECRFTELYDTVDAFILVEANTDHQGHSKPYNFLEHSDRYLKWSEKISYVQVDDLPTVEDDSWSWAREHAQREYVARGLAHLYAQPDDIVMHGDADEIARPLVVRNLRLQRNEVVAFNQRGHFWCIDWFYPPGWNGTVAARVGALEQLAATRGCGPFTTLRDMRNTAKSIPNAGWHLSWLGGGEAAMKKVGSFCHPEVEQRIIDGQERFRRDGVHVDNVVMTPVEVDKTYPKWLQDPANVPASWYRPRP